MKPKETKIESKAAKRKPKGAKNNQRYPKAGQGAPKGSQRTPKVSQRMPKGSKKVTKVHPKVALGAKVDFWSHSRTILDATLVQNLVKFLKKKTLKIIKKTAPKK